MEIHKVKNTMMEFDDTKTNYSVTVAILNSKKMGNIIEKLIKSGDYSNIIQGYTRGGNQNFILTLNHKDIIYDISLIFSKSTNDDPDENVYEKVVEYSLWFNKNYLHSVAAKNAGKYKL